jgi:hypothetical protein
MCGEARNPLPVSVKDRRPLDLVAPKGIKRSGRVGEAERRRGDLDTDLICDPQELFSVGPGVGGHAADLALLEKVLLVVQDWDVAQVDPRDGQRAAPVKGGQRYRDE